MGMRNKRHIVLTNLWKEIFKAYPLWSDRVAALRSIAIYMKAKGKPDIPKFAEVVAHLEDGRIWAKAFLEITPPDVRALDQTQDQTFEQLFDYLGEHQGAIELELNDLRPVDGVISDRGRIIQLMASAPNFQGRLVFAKAIQSLSRDRTEATTEAVLAIKPETDLWFQKLVANYRVRSNSEETDEEIAEKFFREIHGDNMELLAIEFPGEMGSEPAEWVGVICELEPMEL